jgi:hypothetical protein
MSQIQKYWLGILIFGGLATIVYASESLVGLAPFPTPLEAYGDSDLIKSGVGNGANPTKLSLA